MELQLKAIQWIPSKINSIILNTMTGITVWGPLLSLPYYGALNIKANF